MLVRTISLLSIILSALLAGCTTPQAGSGPGAPPGHEDAPRAVVYNAHGTTVVGAWSNPTVSPDWQRIFFNVTANVTAILIELSWNDTAQDLDAFAHANVRPCPYGTFEQLACEVTSTLDLEDFGAFRNRGGEPGAPDNPSRLLILKEDMASVLDLCHLPCFFGSYPRTTTYVQAAVDVEWTNKVTLFYGPLPGGLSGMPRDPH